MFATVSRLAHPFLGSNLPPTRVASPLLHLRFPPISHMSSKPLIDRVKVPVLNKDYWVLHNVLPQEMYNKLSVLTKVSPIPTWQIRELLFSPLAEKLTFSSTHCLENEQQFFDLNNIQDPFLQLLHQELLNKFAKHMKLTGSHEIYLEIARYAPTSNKICHQKWHFDSGALATMIMVLHNDFTHLDGNGLDLSFNAIKGPFDPFKESTDTDVKPLNGDCVSEKYPENGAIVVAGDQGHVIHKMSTLAAKTFSSQTPCYRIVAAIVLKDRSWQRQSWRENQHYLSGS